MEEWRVAGSMALQKPPHQLCQLLQGWAGAHLCAFLLPCLGVEEGLWWGLAAGGWHGGKALPDSLTPAGRLNPPSPLSGS